MEGFTVFEMGVNPMRKQSILKHVIPKGRGNRIHIAVECARQGQLSYVLCKGFPSIGEHLESSDTDMLNCRICEKIATKMLKQNLSIMKGVENEV